MQYLSTGDYVVISPEVRAAMEHEHRRDLLTHPFVMVWQVTMYLAPMLALIRSWMAFGITATLHMVSLVAMYFMWYRHLPREDSEMTMAMASASDSSTGEKGGVKLL
jgi:hypothetical protein